MIATDFEIRLREIGEEAHDEGLDVVRDPARWVEFMQRRGYAERLHGDLLNKAIVDAVVSSLCGGT